LRSLSEEELLEHEIQIEEILEQLEELTQILKPLEQSFYQNTAALRKEKERMTKKYQQLKKRHAQLLAKQSKTIHSFYNRCKTKGVRMPIAKVQANSCSGCYMLLPPQLINEMISDVFKPRNCPHCHRLIFWLPEEESISS